MIFHPQFFAIFGHLTAGCKTKAVLKQGADTRLSERKAGDSFPAAPQAHRASPDRASERHDQQPNLTGRKQKTPPWQKEMTVYVMETAQVNKRLSGQR
ncbi:hypothetical protein CEF21_10425 [Bacillus sp. FJAT-42376]|nr:hypothetical protein CEF21_10425 [Bacillus sp. FJAT-42376]